MRYAKVILDFPVLKFFEYIIPPHIEDQIQPGSFVLIPVEKRLITGLVFEITKSSTYKSSRLKTINKVFDEYQFIGKLQLKLIQWISDYYICGYGESARLLYPNGIEIKSYLWIELSEKYTRLNRPKGVVQNEILKLLEKGPTTFIKLSKIISSKSLRTSLASLEKSGLVVTERKLHKPKVKPQFENLFKAISTDTEGLTPKQIALLENLQNHPLNKIEALQVSGVSESVLKNLVKKKKIEITKNEVFRSYTQEYELPKQDIILNSFQLRAASAIMSSFDKGIFSVFLLFGITGSGKTQVYIETIKHVLNKGKGVICLIPEISLTPQTVARFRNNFGEEVAVLHSRLSSGERFDMWRQVGEGKIKIVVGARSALFAPVSDLGLIIIDEEHEHTYKQGESRPLYHARSVASMRANALSIPVVLGSATPSVESYYNTQIGKYDLLTLPHRASTEMNMPNISIIDLRKSQYTGSGDNVISDLLLEKIDNRLYAGEQVLLLQNRRGFSTFVECTKCGHVEQCENCSVSLSYHSSDGTMRCHFCDFSKKVSQTCGKCDSDKLDRKGIGTQKVEKILQKRFPEVAIERMDYDTTSGKRGHEKILSRFEKKKIDILIGTQMIAKGLDFPNVTLVGVILADVGFYLPDFRSSERTFQILTQVSGRSGRGLIPGEVVIQTFNPDHPIISFVRNQDYNGFYTKEVEDRKLLGYPPFKWLALIRIESPSEEDCISNLKRIKEYLLKESEFQMIEILGPAPSAFAKIKGQFRWQILIKVDQEIDKKATEFRSVLRKLFHNKKNIIPSRARMVIDIDPHMVL